ncbi:rod-binding protein [Hydrogenimonas urashimensis]|uniref:rod-binding protein n=1 Tax=Hydrogenimonas urashimensis TaxID=2740515 RepID=UPI0019167B62|nr:rod-binding protein [Hydrogenimonas urashimensis]
MQIRIPEFSGVEPGVPSLNAKPNERVRLKEQTDAFEAIILKMLLDKSIQGNDPLLPKDPGREIYQSMMNGERSKQLSGAFGYSELLFNYLVEKRA